MKILALLFLLTSVAFAKVPIIEMDNAKAFYVLDGDSISLSMRIKGIDTPEKKQQCRKFPNQLINCGTIAKEHLQALLDYLPGRLSINPVGVGHYGRVLVDVYKGKVNIGKTMVEDGVAYAYGKRYQAEETRAKKEKKGFWSYHRPPLNPKKWRKLYYKKY
ncbi:Nuclease [uncultured Candidatus Thioglobus sp.]|nr:Nuclease [uncultured Candidatus Thioglobus sp.]